MSALEPAKDDAWMPDPHMLRVEPSKIKDYLLNLDHVEGHGKAKFFRAVGFSEEAADEMVQALRSHAGDNKIAQVVQHPYGVKTVVECFIKTPMGKPYCIRSVWNDHLDGKPPKLVTAVPLSALEI
ncbi:MAG: hypothetical protein U1C74_03125 [Phenylobacterium sp.]|nr:hypothetical protein [Phenylobacterium sp.]